MSSSTTDTIEWDEIINNIHSGTCTPIISNQFILNLFFGEKDVIQAWAQKIGYLRPSAHKSNNGEGVQKQLPTFPSENRAETEALFANDYLLTRPNLLTRATQFLSVTDEKGPKKAKRSYLQFLKEQLLDTLDQAALEKIDEDLDLMTFSRLSKELNYPNLKDDPENLLSILADFNIPVFLTTSPHRLIEAALEAAGKNPRTEVYSWREGLWEELKKSIPQEYKPDFDYEPDKHNPLVYHLHGIDDCPDSLVLTEDDHLEFLVKVACDINRPDVVPSIVPKHLSRSFLLLLLGYELHAWDLRVILQGLIKSNASRKLEIGSSESSYAIPIQLVINQKIDEVHNEQLRVYLEKYFRQVKFNFYGEGPLCFLHTLKEKYNRYTRIKRPGPSVPTGKPTHIESLVIQSVTPRFNLENIRTLLTEGFTDEELRRLSYDEPALRPVYEELVQGMGKGAVIQILIEYAERRELIETLLAAAKKLNPKRYETHQPYYEAPAIVEKT
jgi:hypothetical protein